LRKKRFMNSRFSKKGLTVALGASVFALSSFTTVNAHLLYDGYCVAPLGPDNADSCYEHRTQNWCDEKGGTWYPVPGNSDEPNTSCKVDFPEVPLLISIADLSATKNGSGVDLILTTSAELNTAALAIIRGNKLGNGGTEIDVACEFDSAGTQNGATYNCTDDVVGDTYRVLETEYDGRVIVYDEVTPE